MASAARFTGTTTPNDEAAGLDIVASSQSVSVAHEEVLRRTVHEGWTAIRAVVSDDDFACAGAMTWT